MKNKITKKNILFVQQYDSSSINVELDINNQTKEIEIIKQELADFLNVNFYYENTSGEDVHSFNDLSEEGKDLIEFTEEEIIKYLNKN